MALFSGRDLACFRGGRQVFSDLTFSLDAGEALLLTGPNGSGKSTLLRLMAGFLRPNAGQMDWSGSTVYDDLASHQAHLQYVGHLDAIKGVLTVGENLRFWACRDASEQRLGDALDTFELAPLEQVPGRLLSSGQRRRLNLARLIAAPADLWLLDEPGVGLDQAALSALSEVIRSHRDRGGLVVAATHTDLFIDDARSLQLGTFSASNLPELVW
ncbi:MAG: heme ABC exporter ATP-binding protein CcmA [Pseudomonadota bacterium]